MQEILNLKQVKEEDASNVGIKASLLGSLSHGFHVSPGYVLTKDFFQRLLDDNNIRHQIKIMLVGARENSEQIEKNINEIQRLIIGMRMNEELTDSLQEIYYGLGINEGAPLNDVIVSQDEPLVVIRASPVFTGAHTLSFMHVKGTNRLFKGILACFASIYNPQSINENLDMGVMIQKMIIPHISGYIEMDNNEILVNACYGLSGNDSEYDNYIVSQSLELKTVVVEKQGFAYMLEDGRIAKIDLPEIKATSQKLNEKQIAVLARLFMKTPYTDKRIEFVIDHDNYFFTQVIAKEEGKMEEKKKENTIFSVFNANRGDAPPEIPSEPQKETIKKETNKIDKPVTHEPMAVKSPEPANITQPVVEQPKTQEHDMMQAPVREEMPQAGPGVRNEPAQLPEQEDQTDTEIEDEESMLTDVSPEHPHSGLRPLNSAEWLETLRLEHTKLVLSYDLVILNALKIKYKELFSKEPGDFEEMLEELKTKVEIPVEQDIKKIRAMRNKFLYHHRTIDIDELKGAYLATEKFLRSF